MIIETNLQATAKSHRIHPNVIFLSVFFVSLAILTPFVVSNINRQAKVALISPLPGPDYQPPVAAQTNPVTVAMPASDSATSQKDTASTASNSTENAFTLPAGQSEFEVDNPKISGSSYIYLIPVTKTNSVVSVKSKSAGKFTVAISPSENIDLTVDYLLINQ